MLIYSPLANVSTSMAFHNSPPDPSKVWILSKLNICFSCLPNQARSNLYLCFYGLLGSNDALFGLDGHILAPTYQDPKRRHLRQRRKTYRSPPYYGGNNPDFNLCPIISSLVIFSPRIIWKISVSWKDGISPHWRPAACSWRHLGRRQKTEQEWNQMRRDVHQTTSNCRPSIALCDITFLGKKSCPQMEHLEKSQKGLFNTGPFRYSIIDCW